MTEQEWADSTDPRSMLTLATSAMWKQPRISERKLRLFACACCREIWGWLNPIYSDCVLEVADRFADGLATHTELEKLTGQSANIGRCLHPGDAIHNATSVISVAEMHNTAILPTYADLLREIIGNPWKPIKKCNGDIFYPPDRECRCLIEPWLTPTILRIAQSIYDERDFSMTGVLADALEDAGCTDQDILMHLHGMTRCAFCNGTRRRPVWADSDSDEIDRPCNQCKGGWIKKPILCVRGCWALDALLGKE